MVEHVLAYVEVTLENNSLKSQKRFDAAIGGIPQFMNCQRITGDVDYMSFTCSSNTQSLNWLIDNLTFWACLSCLKVFLFTCFKS